MKNNKRGFTLIEILAVIIILGIIAFIAVPSISNYLNSSKETVYSSYEKSMVEAAKNRVISCVTNNDNCELPEKEEEQKLFLDLLIEEGYLENMEDPETKNFCESVYSYVRVQGDSAGDYKYKACLYCGDYFTDDDDCRELNPENDPEPPVCGNTTGDSTRWTNQNRTITIGCTDESSGCLQTVFSKTFSKTTKNGKGTILIRDKSGNTENCNVNAYVDKDPATCNIIAEGNYVESTGWYSLKATAKINDVKDGDGESGLLTYGMGTSIKNRDYNKKDSLEVGKGITTVIGYTKDVAGNEGYCAKEVKVGTEIPKFNMFYGYQIYPDKEPYVLDEMTLSGTTLTTTNTTPKITISNLTKYINVEKVKITLNGTITETTTATLKAHASGVELTKTATMQYGAKEIVFVLKGNEIKTYDNFEIILGTLSGKAYNINKIEILTKDGTLWTNKDITLYVEPIDEGMKTTEVSFDNGVTWTSTFDKTFTTKEINRIYTRNGIGMQSNAYDFTTRIDKVMPVINVTATKANNGAVITQGTWVNSGLNFTFNIGTVGESGYHIYYCKDTNNTCTPNVEVTNGQTVTSFNSITTDYYIRYRIASNAGYTSDISTYLTKFDTTGPSCTSSGDSTSWTKNNRTISWGCSDTQAGCNPSYSGGNTTYSTTTKTATIAQYEIRDKAGNVTTCPARTANVYVDKTAPSCTNSGDSTTWTKSNRTISWGCSDGQTTCTGSGSTTYSTTTKTATIAAYTIKDSAGNEATCPARTANVYVDKTAPGCTNSGDSTSWTKSNRTISWGCSDGQTTCTGSGSQTYSTTTKTAKIAAYTVTDAVGNSATCPARTANVYVDKTAPTCTNSGDSTTWTKSNRTISWGCSDGQTTCTGSGSTTYSKTTKTASIAAYTVTDAVGNSATCPARTANVYVDKDAPSCSLKVTSGTVGNNDYYKSNVEIGFNSASDGNSGVNSYGIGDYSTKTATLTSDTTGTTYTGKIKDNAGNTNTCTITIKKDATKPTCSVSKSNTNKTSGVTTTVTCSDGTSGVASCDSGGSELTTGTYTYNVKDKAGNKNTCSTSVSSKLQSRYKSCTQGNECTDSGCGTYYTYSGRCQCKYLSENTSVKAFSGRPSCPGTAGCRNICGGANGAGYGGNQMSCYSVSHNKTCTTISVCGCKTWGDYSSWADASSCTEGETSDHNKYYKCRTIYY